MIMKKEEQQIVTNINKKQVVLMNNVINVMMELQERQIIMFQYTMKMIDKRNVQELVIVQKLHQKEKQSMMILKFIDVKNVHSKPQIKYGLVEQQINLN